MKTNYKTILLIYCCSIIIHQQVLGNNYYVDPSSPAAVSTGSITYPWKTILQLNNHMNALSPGDSIFLKSGSVFYGSLYIHTSGTADRPIVFSTYGGSSMPILNSNTDAIIINKANYVVVEKIKITDTRLPHDITHRLSSNISTGILLQDAACCTIQQCDISLAGIGIGLTSNSNYTLIRNNHIHDLRMVVNSPKSLHDDDDYGACAIVIGSSNNKIMNNNIENCWAYSFDYNFDGGAFEFFGDTMNNNEILYNTVINCNGCIEMGSNSNGKIYNTLVAYNKIINCGTAGVFHTTNNFSVNINNVQFYNNIMVETISQYSKPDVLFWMSGATIENMIVFRNNIVCLSSGINFIAHKFSDAIVHTNNIFIIQKGALGFVPVHTEAISSLRKIFKKTDGDATGWDYHLTRNSIAINWGITVGISRDLAGNKIIGQPDAGVYEYDSAAFQ